MVRPVLCGSFWPEQTVWYITGWVFGELVTSVELPYRRHSFPWVSQNSRFRINYYTARSERRDITNMWAAVDLGCLRPHHSEQPMVPGWWGFAIYFSSWRPILLYISFCVWASTAGCMVANSTFRNRAKNVPLTREYLVLRIRVDYPIPRKPALSLHLGWICCLLTRLHSLPTFHYSFHCEHHAPSG